MSKRRKSNDENIDDPRLLMVHGTCVKFILKECGFSQKDFARACRTYKALNGGKMATTLDAVRRQLELRTVKEVYLVVLERLVTPEKYNKYLNAAFEQRPDWFSPIEVKM